MTPVIQTKCHGNGQNGNCVAAALASILDLPIKAIPPFEDMKLEKPDLSDPTDFDWWRGVWTWLLLMGYWLEVHEEPKWDEWPNVVVAGGESPRFPDETHAVLWSRDGLIHDPHPDGTGIVGEPTDYWILRPAPRPGLPA